MIDTLPRLLAGKEASLVLFSSYRQMNEVAVGLRAKGMSLLVQGKRPAAPCSSCTNRSATAARPASSLAPAASPEGLDLPGHYLTNLVITKLPFAVPNSPWKRRPPSG